MAKGQSAEKAIKDIRRKTMRQFSAEEKIRIVMEGMRGEESISALCRREGIAANLYYRWSKDFLRFISYYNERRYPESLGNITPTDMYDGRQYEIMTRRETIKQRTLAHRRRENLRDAA